MARVCLAVRDRAGLVVLGDRVGRDRVDQAGRDQAALAGRAARARADLADRVGLEVLGVLEDMNRVAPGVMADMGLAALASLGVLEDMDLAVPNLAGRADLVALVGLGLRALDPEGRAARDLSLGRVHRGRTLTALDRVLLDRMPADLDRTRPADRLWEPTTRVEATLPAARMRLAERTRRAEATLAEATLAEATLAEATSPGKLIAKASKHLPVPPVPAAYDA